MVVGALKQPLKLGPLMLLSPLTLCFAFIKLIYFAIIPIKPECFFCKQNVFFFSEEGVMICMQHAGKLTQSNVESRFEMLAAELIGFGRRWGMKCPISHETKVTIKSL